MEGFLRALITKSQHANISGRGQKARREIITHHSPTRHVSFHQQISGGTPIALAAPSSRIVHHQLTYSEKIGGHVEMEQRESSSCLIWTVVLI
jgi:hypothetical protein